MSERFSFDDKPVLKLAEILNETQLTEIEYQIGEVRIKVARQLGSPSTYVTPSQLQSAPPSTVSTLANSPPNVEKSLDYSQHPGSIKAPMVGTVYASATPEGVPFVQVGSEVKMGQTLVIIEAMKVMNQIRAPKDGKVSQIFFKDGDPVEYDHILLIVE